jgi:hypothetical protein
MTHCERASVGPALALALLALGCGGGAAGLSSANGPTFKSASFFPTAATGEDGKAAPEIWWRLRVAAGAPVVISADGQPGSIDLDDVEVRIPAGAAQRTTKLAGTMTIGAASSRLREDIVETLAAGSPVAISGEQVHQTQAVSSMGRRGTLDLTGIVTPSAPVRQIVDRTDLDRLPVGHVDVLTYTSSTSITGTVTSNGASHPSSSQELDMVRETWTVAQQLPTMDVLGKTYARVVKMTRVFESTETVSGVKETTTSTLWFAAGIGLVHGLAVYTDIPELNFAPIDLFDTNLRQ